MESEDGTERRGLGEIKVKRTEQKSSKGMEMESGENGI